MVLWFQSWSNTTSFYFHHCCLVQVHHLHSFYTPAPHKCLENKNLPNFGNYKKLFCAAIYCFPHSPLLTCSPGKFLPSFAYKKIVPLARPPTPTSTFLLCNPWIVTSNMPNTKFSSKLGAYQDSAFESCLILYSEAGFNGFLEKP